MKYFSTTIISIFCLIFLHAQTQPEYLKKKKGKVTIFSSSTPPTKTEGKVLHHYKTGEWKSYDELGRLTKIENYSKGILNGPCVDYYAGGEVYSTGKYLNGNKYGQWEYYERSRMEKNLENYDAHGKLCGVQETFNFDGKVKTFTIIDSLKNKKVFNYNMYGKLISKESFSNDVLEGSQYYYSTNTFSSADTLPERITNYVHGQREGLSTCYKNGIMTRKENNHNGFRDGYCVDWAPNGILLDSTSYKDGRKDGNSFYFQNGKIKSKITFVQGKADGPSTSYNENGAVESINWYKNDEIDSMMEFYPDGTKKNYWAKNPVTNTSIYKSWSENKTEVLEISYDQNRSVTIAKVYSDKGVLLKAKTVAYNQQVEKYLPEDFQLGEKSGELIPVEHIAVQASDDDDLPPPPTLSIESVDTQAEPPGVFQYAEVMPSFPGEDGAFTKYIKDNLKYPQLEKDAGLQGTVYVQFVVEKDGSISGGTILKGVNGAPGFSKEALRLIMQMPKWNPGQMNGRKVRVSMVQPVKFVLP